MAEQETNVLVAIPRSDDPVWKVSTEKVPHLTLLYLEDVSTDDALPDLMQFLQHAVKSSLCPFYLEVNHRDTLGSDDADVVFFSSPDGPDPLYSANEDIKRLAQFRQQLLQNPSIAQAYNAVPQFPEWTPHLTLGYPTAPAKDDAIDYGITYVQFDKIALWTADYAGLDFQMGPKRDLEVSMSDSDLVNDILAHHGVKGMKWGVRRDGTPTTTVTTSKFRRPETSVTVSQRPGKFVTTSGGKRSGAAEDAVRVAASRQLAKKSTTDALTTKQLQEAVTRMNLEQQYSQLAKKSDRRNAGTKFVHKLLGIKHPSAGNGNSANQPSPATAAAKQVAKALAKSAVA